MFGITDAHAEDSTRGEEEENLGYTNKMSSMQEKRPASPGYVQPLAKHRKLDQKFVFHQKIDHDDNYYRDGKSRNNNLSSNDALFEQNGEEKQAVNSRKSLNYFNSQEVRMGNARLSKSNTDIEKYQIDYNLGNIRLKELRVILEDIKHDTKNGMKALLLDTNLWEVEKILAKKEIKGIPTYLIKWKNWDSEYNTWEPMSNLVNCSDILEEFEKNRLQMIDRFKKETNFYPNDKDIEEFLNYLKHRGETLTSISIESNAVYTSIHKF